MNLWIPNTSLFTSCDLEGLANFNCWHLGMPFLVGVRAFLMFLVLDVLSCWSTKVNTTFCWKGHTSWSSFLPLSNWAYTERWKLISGGPSGQIVRRILYPYGSTKNDSLKKQRCEAAIAFSKRDLKLENDQKNLMLWHADSSLRKCVFSNTNCLISALEAWRTFNSSLLENDEIEIEWRKHIPMMTTQTMKCFIWSSLAE